MWTRSLQSDLLPHVSSAKSLLGLPSTTALAPSRSLPHATECQLKWLAGCLLVVSTSSFSPQGMGRLSACVHGAPPYCLVTYSSAMMRKELWESSCLLGKPRQAGPLLNSQALSGAFDSTR